MSDRSSRYCDNGNNHQHIAKGSMKMAHNLDDRKERGLLKCDDQDIENAEAAVDKQQWVNRRFKNLDWLNKR
jgi:hypothetical protein